jgi:hypothetical protein
MVLAFICAGFHLVMSATLIANRHSFGGQSKALTSDGCFLVAWLTDCPTFLKGRHAASTLKTAAACVNSSLCCMHSCSAHR